MACAETKARWIWRRFEVITSATNRQSVGFTALCEQFGRCGTVDTLTAEVNAFLGSIVQGVSSRTPPSHPTDHCSHLHNPFEVVLESSGDVVKFAGDAFLAVWPCDPDDSETLACLSAVISTGLAIQVRRLSHPPHL